MTRRAAYVDGPMVLLRITTVGVSKLRVGKEVGNGVRVGAGEFVGVTELVGDKNAGVQVTMTRLSAP